MLFKLRISKPAETNNPPIIWVQYARICTHIYTRARILARARSRKHSCTRFVAVRTKAHTYAHAYTCTHARLFKHMHMYMHTSTHACAHSHILLALMAARICSLALTRKCLSPLFYVLSDGLLGAEVGTQLRLWSWQCMHFSCCWKWEYCCAGVGKLLWCGTIC